MAKNKLTETTHNQDQAYIYFLHQLQSWQGLTVPRYTTTKI